MSCRQAEKVIRPFLPAIRHDTFLRLIRNTPVELLELKWEIIQQVQQDYKTGSRITPLAKEYQLSRGTIYNYLKKQTPPLKTKRKSKPSQLRLQPYYDSIILYDEQRFTTEQIVVKIHAEGYDGTTSAVR